MDVSPTGQPGDGSGQFVAGALFGVLVLILVVLTWMVMTGRLNLAYDWRPEWLQNDAIIVEARPTAAWPFRDEWLTPKPRP